MPPWSFSRTGTAAGHGREILNGCDHNSNETSFPTCTRPTWSGCGRERKCLMGYSSDGGFTWTGQRAQAPYYVGSISFDRTGRAFPRRRAASYGIEPPRSPLTAPPMRPRSTATWPTGPACPPTNSRQTAPIACVGNPAPLDASATLQAAWDADNLYFAVRATTMPWGWTAAPSPGWTMPSSSAWMAATTTSATGRGRRPPVYGHRGGQICGPGNLLTVARWPPWDSSGYTLESPSRGEPGGRSRRPKRSRASTGALDDDDGERREPPRVARRGDLPRKRLLGSVTAQRGSNLFGAPSTPTPTPTPTATITPTPSPAPQIPLSYPGDQNWAAEFRDPGAERARSGPWGWTARQSLRGGQFTTTGGVAAYYVARWDPATSSWSALGSGMDGAVNALSVDGLATFTPGASSATAGGAPASRVARWDPETASWSALGAG